MENKKMNIVYKKVKDLIPYENNPRNNDDAVDAVANSIREFGFKVPIVVDQDNVIVAGHTRYKACKKLGISEVPCIVAEDLTDEQIKAFRIADNKVGELATWDMPKLQLEQMEIKDIDLEQFGFDIEPLEVEPEKKKENKNYLEQMELKTFEHHDYLVFLFDNEFDWLSMCNEFGIKKVDCGWGETQKIGLGRVIDGKELIERLRAENRNNK